MRVDLARLRSILGEEGREGVWQFELDEATVVQTGLLRGSGSWLFDLRFLLRLRSCDFLE